MFDRLLYSWLPTTTAWGFDPENKGSSSEANNPEVGADDFAEGFTSGGLLYNELNEITQINIRNNHFVCI